MKPAPATGTWFEKTAMGRRAAMLALAQLGTFSAATATFAQAPAGGTTPGAPAKEDPAKKTSPAKPDKTAIKKDESDLFFDPARRQIPFLRIDLTPEDMAKWKAAPRTYTPAVMIENDRQNYTVDVKVKGSAGSTRDIDDKPAITVKFKGQDVRFHTMDKIHLNNSVQDASYMCEWLCASILQDVGYARKHSTPEIVKLLEGAGK